MFTPAPSSRHTRTSFLVIRPSELLSRRDALSAAINPATLDIMPKPLSG
jgi:hypothetical protein